MFDLSTVLSAVALAKVEGIAKADVRIHSFHSFNSLIKITRSFIPGVSLPTATANCHCAAPGGGFTPTGMPCANTAPEYKTMSANPNSLLSWFDRMLLIAIVGLLLMGRFETKKETAIMRTANNQIERPPQSADESEAPPHYVVTASQHTISFSPEGVTQSRVSRIAQALSHDSGWQDAPVRQAADMREHDGLYHIAFVLSQQIDEKSVLVSTDGNLLSLIASPIGNPNAKILKQFYIPCPADQVGPLKTTVSNGIVRVTIHLAQ